MAILKKKVYRVLIEIDRSNVRATAGFGFYGRLEAAEAARFGLKQCLEAAYFRPANIDQTRAEC